MQEVSEMTEIVENYEKERDEYIEKAQEATSKKLKELTEEIIKQLPVIKNVEYHNIAGNNNLYGHTYSLDLCRISYKDQEILHLETRSVYDGTKDVGKAIHMRGANYGGNVDTVTADIQDLSKCIIEIVKEKSARIDREERPYTLKELQRELDALKEFEESFADANCSKTKYEIKISEDKLIEIDLDGLRHCNDLLDEDKLDKLKEDIKSGIARKEVVGTTSRARYNIRCKVESNVGSWQQGSVLPSMLKSKIKIILKGTE